MGKENGEQTKTRAAQDPEIAAMSKIARILGELSETDRASVVAWVGRKFAPETRAVKEMAAWNAERSTADTASVKR